VWSGLKKELMGIRLQSSEAVLSRACSLLLQILTLVKYMSLAEVAGVCVVGPEEGADGYQTPVLRGRPFPGSQPSHTDQVRIVRSIRYLLITGFLCDHTVLDVKELFPKQIIFFFE
jgi:hypothetical protein